MEFGKPMRFEIRWREGAWYTNNFFRSQLQFARGHYQMVGVCPGELNYWINRKIIRAV